MAPIPRWLWQFSAVPTGWPLGRCIVGRASGGCVEGLQRHTEDCECREGPRRSDLVVDRVRQRCDLACEDGIEEGDSIGGEGGDDRHKREEQGDRDGRDWPVFKLHGGLGQHNHLQCSASVGTDTRSSGRIFRAAIQKLDLKMGSFFNVIGPNTCKVGQCMLLLRGVTGAWGDVAMCVRLQSSVPAATTAVVWLRRAHSGVRADGRGVVGRAASRSLCSCAGFWSNHVRLGSAESAHHGVLIFVLEQIEHIISSQLVLWHGRRCRGVHLDLTIGTSSGLEARLVRQHEHRRNCRRCKVCWCK